jgi:hypothetical protein
MKIAKLVLLTIKLQDAVNDLMQFFFIINKSEAKVWKSKRRERISENNATCKWEYWKQQYN